MKKKLLLAGFALLFFLGVQAQDRVLSGRITDSADGAPPRRSGASAGLTPAAMAAMIVGMPVADACAVADRLTEVQLRGALQGLGVPVSRGATSARELRRLLQGRISGGGGADEGGQPPSVSAAQVADDLADQGPHAVLAARRAP